MQPEAAAARARLSDGPNKKPKGMSGLADRFEGVTEAGGEYFNCGELEETARGYVAEHFGEVAEHSDEFLALPRLEAAAVAAGGASKLEAAAAGSGSSKQETKLHDSRRPVSALAWSPDGSTLAVGNVEGAIDLYDVASWARLARCRGHSTKVTQLDWSRDAALLQSNCSAYEILYWEGRSGRQVRSPQREYTQWDGWSCTLGWPVMGIWQEGFDPSDVNAAHASDDGSLLVVSDDRGGVCLFRFPCVAPRAACFRAAGHASHVSSVRWLLGSGRCVSVGGHDRAVMQWRLVEWPEPRAAPLALKPPSRAVTQRNDPG